MNSLLPLAIRVPGSQDFSLQLNYTTGFLESPACRWQTVGLLSLHSCMSQSLQYILYTYLYISYWFCFSGEP